MLRGRDAGTRRWLSHAEFERLRDDAAGFSGLMASQSRLNTWQVRVDGDAPEPATGRLVSDGYFDVLGVHPAAGRLSATAEAGGDPSSVVISYTYWQRRFGGRPDAIGATLIVRDTPVAIAGVAPAAFTGETSGQQPDLWLPLRLQPRVLPGGDWLHEEPPDKVMWLHVFGRLKPGVTLAQAEAEANAIFQSGLESFYGPARRQEAADQRLRLQPAARGASASRDEISSSLTILLASAGVLLLIACANLATLLLARGSARKTEIAVRVSLGASRQRIIRQLVTESLTLAAIGGILGIAVAFAMHAGLLLILQDVEPHFFIAFAFPAPVLAFFVAAMLTGALMFGALPAWQATSSDPGSGLSGSSRGAISSAGELRASRWLVGVQLALAAPLLVSAGLFVQTIVNLQRPDLGFDAERLLLARVDLGRIVLDTARRDRVLRELEARIRRMPGVDSATFSQLGLFGGGFSTAWIEVSGGRSAATSGRDSALDRVGANYFTTLRIPVLRGRDISETDRAESQKVSIVNDAFARVHFDGHDPVGMLITTVDDGVRTTYEVVGVVPDARTHSLRDDVEPRFFIPAEQRPSSATTRTFVIRAAAGASGVGRAIREAFNGMDGELSSSSVEAASIEDYLSPLVADERIIARLAVVFGTVALTLAAVGLYGLLSYGVSRRSSEIAIRMALGAQRRSIVLMIARDTAGLTAAGLLAGGVLAHVASRLVENRLYGVAPHDPLNSLLAAGVLVAVAFLAAYLPARRASRIDPMAALRRE
jgi:predicted permease